MSELALQLIAENKRTRSPFLDLGKCGLKYVPAEIGELVWLEELSFASEWWFFDGVKSQYKETQNHGKANQIAHLWQQPKSRIKSGLKQTAQPNPFVGLVKLKALILNGGFGKKSLLDNLSPLAVLENLQQLDIFNTEVTDLSPLSGLAQLQSLIFWRTGVTDLSPLSGLAQLQSLHFWETGVTDLSPLSGLAQLQKLVVGNIGVTDLSPLSGLAQLQWLHVANTGVTDLSPLSGLAQLKWLDVSDTGVTNLSPLSDLAQLQTLVVLRTGVTDLSPLSSLLQLQVLRVSGTGVTDLSPLSGLVQLQKLVVSNTQITDLKPVLELIKNGLPVKWSYEKSEGDGIYINNCPLSNPPAEIAQQGNEAILNYFNEQQSQGTAKLYEAKMLLIGEGGAGKTSLLRRLFQPEHTELPEEQETTKGIDIHQHAFKTTDQHDFRLNVWDFGGQEIYHATHQFFLTKRSLYVLLDDTRKDDKSVHDPRVCSQLSHITVETKQSMAR